MSVESRFALPGFGLGSSQPLWSRAGAARGAAALGGAEPPANGDAKATAQDAALRKKLGEFAGSVFYATLIEEMQKSTLRTDVMKGGRGEEAFRGQLALELGKSLGGSKRDAVTERLYHAARKRLVDRPAEGKDAA